MALIGGILGIRYFNNMWFKERPNHLTFSFDDKPINFVWSETTYEDYIEKKDAILIPVQIQGYPNKFFFQFDTGSPTSIIYGNGLKSLQEAGLQLNEVDIDERKFVESIDMNLGGSNVSFKKMKVLVDYGDFFNVEDSTKHITIGTIGSDFLSQKIVEIDFKNQFIQFTKNRKDWMPNQFSSFDFQGRRFMLPCTIDNKVHEMFYDSGSSAFGLITTKGRYNRYVSHTHKEVSYDANRWGDSMLIYHNATSKSMQMAGLEIPLQRVSYVDMYSAYQGLITPFTSIGGWLGNKPFTEYSLIFDVPNEEFAIVQK